MRVLAMESFLVAEGIRRALCTLRVIRFCFGLRCSYVRGGFRYEIENQSYDYANGFE